MGDSPFGREGGTAMSIDVYWGSGSPYSWRALLALEAKQVAYGSRLLEFSKGQHKAPDYLALNPRGTVPTLKDGEDIICESLAIVAYLDRKFPEPPLFGRTSKQAGTIWRLWSECAYYLEVPTRSLGRPLFSGGWQDKVNE